MVPHRATRPTPVSGQDAWVRVRLASGTELDIEYLSVRRRRPAVAMRGTNGMRRPAREQAPYHRRAPRTAVEGKVKRI